MDWTKTPTLAETWLGSDIHTPRPYPQFEIRSIRVGFLNLGAIDNSLWWGLFCLRLLGCSQHPWPLPTRIQWHTLPHSHDIKNVSRNFEWQMPPGEQNHPCLRTSCPRFKQFCCNPCDSILFSPRNPSELDWWSYRHDHKPNPISIFHSSPLFLTIRKKCTFLEHTSAKCSELEFATYCHEWFIIHSVE